MACHDITTSHVVWCDNDNDTHLFILLMLYLFLLKHVEYIPLDPYLTLIWRDESEVDADLVSLLLPYTVEGSEDDEIEKLKGTGESNSNSDDDGSDTSNSDSDEGTYSLYHISGRFHFLFFL